METWSALAEPKRAGESGEREREKERERGESTNFLKIWHELKS